MKGRYKRNRTFGYDSPEQPIKKQRPLSRHMQLKDKTTIVTGGGSGIGRALCIAFAAEGARVVVADLDADDANATATKINGLGVACDVTVESDIKNLVTTTRRHFGAVDLFCSNAGILKGEPDHSASASNADWQACWNVHVMAHVYAARAVLPDMIERGSGYLVHMASAAGLLSQIGDAAYSTTKHAAVGFAESLTITHGDDGIKVSVICPQYVATPMLGYDEGQANIKTQNVLTPEQVATAVVKGIEAEQFLILPHPEVAEFVQLKCTNYDRWLGGMRKLRRNIVSKLGSTRAVEMHKLV